MQEGSNKVERIRHRRTLRLLDQVRTPTAFVPAPATDSRLPGFLSKHGPMNQARRQTRTDEIPRLAPEVPTAFVPTQKAPEAPESAVEARSDAERRVRWDLGCHLVCRLTTLHPERALSRALVQHLAQEMPDIEFTLSARIPTDIIWVCGYQEGHAELIADLRRENDEAFIVITGRGVLETWEDEVLAAGADTACGWPIAYNRLSQIFHERETGSVSST